MENRQTLKFSFLIKVEAYYIDTIGNVNSAIVQVAVLYLLTQLQYYKLVGQSGTSEVWWQKEFYLFFPLHYACEKKNFKDGQYHLFLFHLEVPVADVGAITICTNTLTSLTADPKELFKCHEGWSCREPSCLYCNSRKRVSTWMEWFMCDRLEATEQLRAKAEDRKLSQVQ